MNNEKDDELNTNYSNEETKEYDDDSMYIAEINLENCFKQRSKQIIDQ